MQLRFLEYLVALEQERHFARAARRCNVSQPTLSAGLATLEEQLGKRLVERNRRFTGFTSEGSAILPWARQMLSAFQGLSAAVSSVSGQLAGHVRIGCIPAAMPVAGHLAKAISDIHPLLDVSFISMASSAIGLGLEAYELEAGIAYANGATAHHASEVSLYSDRFLFIAGSAACPAHASIPIDVALAHRLCLLPDAMQNRRNLDKQLAELGLEARAAVVADSFDALISMVVTGHYATFLPESFRPILPPSVHVSSIDPVLPATTVSLFVSRQRPISALAQAVLDAAASMLLPEHFVTHDR